MQQKPRQLIWIIIVLILAIAAITVFLGYSKDSQDYFATGQLIILAITLAFIVVYVWDTRRIANATEKKWEMELEPKLMYQMSVDPSEPKSKTTLFGLINPTDYIIEARVDCNFKIYGEPVTHSGAYDGTEIWTVFPYQISQGHFSLDALLSKKGKTRDQMIGERNGNNASKQLTMDLEITFESETGRARKYPPRQHHFDFERWVWIPEITKLKQP